MHDELAEHLMTLKRDDCYHVDSLVKESEFERTERVYFFGSNESQLGPFIRKIIKTGTGVGEAYIRLYEAQKSGKRFLYLPHLVECHNAGDDLVVVMEHINGETLSDVLYRCDPSVLLAYDVFPKICEAVRELHESFDPPLIHRDLKPSNIMLSQNSFTIIDFGIARTYKEDAEEDTRHFGTRAYAPPEQYGYGQTDVRSDVYALGLLLYYCLTEVTPDAKTRMSGFVSPQIPEPLRRIIVRATAFNPDERYARVLDLETAFLQACITVFDELNIRPSIPILPKEYPGKWYSSELVFFQKEQESKTTETPLRAHDSFPKTGSAPPSVIQDNASQTLKASHLLSRIPQGFGNAWNIGLILFFALLCLGCVINIVDPSSGNSQYASAPLFLRLVAYTSLLFLIVAPVCISFLDRRMFKKIIPRFALCPVEKRLAICFIVLLLGCLILGIAMQFLK